MQESIDGFLKSCKFYNYVDVYKVEVPTIVLREFSVPEVNRRSDHILLINRRRVVNIECKLDDITTVIKQAKDHLRWCDYSIICLPPDGLYVSNSYKKQILDEGIGLWYWFKNIGVFEFILPAYNRKKDLELRKKIINRVLEYEPKPNLFEKQG